MLMASFAGFAQSPDQNFPTPVTTNEIRGTIRARDIGDSRATTYFYAFDGEQGDVFINIQTKNFDGDIDVFAVEGLRPLSKIVLYADAGISETGRIVYLRKSERLLLRIEGRSPDDNPATFVIKFAGSFIALKPTKKLSDPGPPKIVGDDTDGVRLSSIGAIETSKPQPKAESAVKTDPKPPARPPVRKTVEPKKETAAATEKPSLKVIVESTLPPADTTPKETGSTKSGTAAAKPGKAKPKEEKPRAAEPDPLANIHLIILLKNGKRLERVMSEVLRFSTDRGVMTVIGKDGTVVRYLLTDVAKVTIE